MGLREHAGREPACRNWFRELRLFRWWTAVRQDVAANDVCVLPGSKKLSMKMAVTTTTHHSYTWCCVAQVSTALQEYSDPGPCTKWSHLHGAIKKKQERSSEEVQFQIHQESRVHTHSWVHRRTCVDGSRTRK